jgi:nitrogen regulatory protein PII
MVYVLNDVHQLDKFLIALKEEKIKGATIINSTGMGRMLSESDDMNILGSLKFLFDGPRSESRVILMALEDEQIDVVLNVIDRIAGDLSKPNTGIVFTLPIDFIKGYKK